MMKVIKWVTHPVIVLPVVLAVALYMLELSQSTEPTADEWKQIHSESEKLAQIQRKAAEQSNNSKSDDAKGEVEQSPAIQPIETAIPTPVNGQVTDDSESDDTPVNSQVTDAETDPENLEPYDLDDGIAPSTDMEMASEDEPQPEQAPIADMNPFAALAPMGHFPAPQHQPKPPVVASPSDAPVSPAVSAKQKLSVPQEPWRKARRIAAEGDLDTAAELYRKLIEQHGDNADLYGELGNIQLMRHDFQAAADAYFEAAKQLHAQGLTWRAWQLHQVIVQLDNEKADTLRDTLNKKP